MELPQPPTDNLYKFMALSGIAVIGISLAPLLHTHRLRVESIRLDGDIHILRTQVSWTTELRKSHEVREGFLKQDIASMEQRLDALKEDVAKASHGHTSGELSEETPRDLQDIAERRRALEEGTRELEDRLEEVAELNKEFAEVSKKDEISFLQLEAKIREHKYIQTVARCESVAGILGLVCGLILAIKGFTLWHRRLQVLQDKLIRVKAEGVNEEADK